MRAVTPVRACAVLACGILLVAGLACASTVPPEALQLSEQSFRDRQLQTRIYDTTDEVAILSASAGVLQDLGFNLDESEVDLGVIVASKERSAVETGQVLRAIALTILTRTSSTYDKRQRIRVSLVSRPHGPTGERTAVRVTFQRLVWDNEDELTQAERLGDPKMYQEFFVKLSTAMFLEAHQI